MKKMMLVAGMMCAGFAVAETPSVEGDHTVFAHYMTCFYKN